MINYFKGGDTMLLKLITKKFPCCKPNARLKSRSLYRMAENPEKKIFTDLHKITCLTLNGYLNTLFPDFWLCVE